MAITAKNRRYVFFFLLIICPLGACNSAKNHAQDFCAYHAAGQLDQAYKLLSLKNRAEISQIDYQRFDWDQRTFDLRLLQKRDNCQATILSESPTDAIARIDLALRGDDRLFSCLLPMIKEEGSWQATSYWQPALDYQEQLRRLQKTLLEQYNDIAIKDDLTYLRKSSQPLTEYYDKLSRITNDYQLAKGSSTLGFCFGNLNPDGGQAMAYNYMLFERKIAAIPKELLNQEARYQELLKLINNYKPQATTITKGLRLDLLYSQLVFEERDNSSRIEYSFAIWGKIKEPLAWQIDIFDKTGAKVQEGHGKEAEVISDFATFVPDAPPITMIIIRLPKLPDYTKRLEVIFTEPDQLTSYRLALPVAAEYLEKRH